MEGRRSRGAKPTFLLLHGVAETGHHSIFIYIKMHVMDGLHMV